METVLRRWTIATWLLAHAAAERDRVIGALQAVDADAIALQSVSNADVRYVSEALDFHHAWALSHYPTSRLFPRSGLGLGLLTPHKLGDTSERVISERSSTWSRHRRIAQGTVVHRADHSGYLIAHAVGLAADAPVPAAPAPLVRIVPEQVDQDVSRAVRLPESASLVTSDRSVPVPGAAALLVVTFEMPWVQGDFPVV